MDGPVRICPPPFQGSFFLSVPGCRPGLLSARPFGALPRVVNKLSRPAGSCSNRSFDIPGTIPLRPALAAIDPPLC